MSQLSNDLRDVIDDLSTGFFQYETTHELTKQILDGCDLVQWWYEYISTNGISTWYSYYSHADDSCQPRISVCSQKRGIFRRPVEKQEKYQTKKCPSLRINGEFNYSLETRINVGWQWQLLRPHTIRYHPVVVNVEERRHAREFTPTDGLLSQLDQSMNYVLQLHAVDMTIAPITLIHPPYLTNDRNGTFRHGNEQDRIVFESEIGKNFVLPSQPLQSALTM